MLDFLFNGLYSIFATVIGWLINAFMEAFTVDMQAFLDAFPGVEALFTVLQAMSWGILTLIILYAAVKSMFTINSSEAENPLMVVLKAVPAGAMIISAHSIVDILFSLGRAGYEQIAAYQYSTPVDMGTKVIDSVAVGVVFVSSGSALGGAIALLSLILLIILTWQLVKLMLECIERYVTVCAICYLSPLVYPCIASKSTSSIVKNFYSMLAGQMLLMWINAWSLSMVYEGFVGLSNATATGWMVKFMILLAFLLVAQKMDNVLQQLGFHNIRGGAGGFLGRTLAMAMLAANAVRQFGGGKGAAGGGGKTAPVDPAKQTQGVTAYRGTDGKMRALTPSGAPASKEQISGKVGSLQEKQADALGNQAKAQAASARNAQQMARHGADSSQGWANKASALNNDKAGQAFAAQAEMYGKQIADLQQASKDMYGDNGVSAAGGVVAGSSAAPYPAETPSTANESIVPNTASDIAAENTGINASDISDGQSGIETSTPRNDNVGIVDAPQDVVSPAPGSAPLDIDATNSTQSVVTAQVPEIQNNGAPAQDAGAHPASSVSSSVSAPSLESAPAQVVGTPASAAPDTGVNVPSPAATPEIPSSAQTVSASTVASAQMTEHPYVSASEASAPTSASAAPTAMPAPAQSVGASQGTPSQQVGSVAAQGPVDMATHQTSEGTHSAVSATGTPSAPVVAKVENTPSSPVSTPATAQSSAPIASNKTVNETTVRHTQAASSQGRVRPQNHGNDRNGGKGGMKGRFRKKK